MECADDSGGVNIWDVVQDPAKPLYALAQVFTFFMGDDVQIASLAMSLVASSEGANKIMTQIRPRRNGIHWQVHQPSHDFGFECQREVIGKHLVVVSSSSLHRDGVDAEELRRVGLAVVLLANIGFERMVGGPLELSQLTGEGRTTHLVR